MAKKKSKKSTRKKSKTQDLQDLLKNVSKTAQAGDFDAAESLCRESIERDPDNVEAHYLLGRIKRDQEDFDEAITQFKVALKKDKDKRLGGEIHYWLGRTYDHYLYKERSAKLAIKHYEKARSYDLYNPDALMQIIYHHHWEKDQDKIKKLCKEGIEEFPHDPGCYLRLALIQKKEDMEEALATLESAIKSGVDSSSIWYELAKIHLSNRQYTDAISCYKKILDLKDEAMNFPVIHILIAQAFSLSKVFQKSIKHYNSAITCAKQKEHIYASYFGMIAVYCRINKHEEALEIFNRIDFDEYLYESRDTYGLDHFHLDIWGDTLDFRSQIEEAVLLIKEVIRAKQDEFLENKLILMEALVAKDNFAYALCEELLHKALQRDIPDFAQKILTDIYMEKLYDKEDEILKSNEFGNYVMHFFRMAEHFREIVPEIVEEVLDAIIEDLWEHKKYKYIAKLYDLFDIPEIGGRDVLFKVAYSYNEVNETDKAQIAYQCYMDAYGATSAVLNNLANIYQNEGELDIAIEMYERAIKLDPDDEIPKGNLERAIDEKETKKKVKERERKERAKAERLLKTAPERWPTIDRYKKRLLLTLEKIDGFSGFDELAELCNMEERWAKVHFNKLVGLGMVIHDALKNRYEINPEIREHLEKEKSHSVAINVIRASENIRFKPVFNSRLEYSIYNIMIGLFPNHLVFPNMALSSIFDYGRMKGILEKDVFKYYLMASVDICIVSTASYLPIVAYEIDSPYHDEPAQEERDRKKNLIFEKGGIYLLRLRQYGEPSLLEVRKQIIDVTKELGSKIDPLEKEGKLVGLIREIDFEAFGEQIRSVAE